MPYSAPMAVKRFCGANLRRFRLAKGWTQAELAERAGIRRERQIIRWENNQNEPRIETAVGLAEALGVSVDELFAPVDSEVIAPAGDPFRGVAPAAAAGGGRKRGGGTGEAEAGVTA
jgi:transcriptional regulator with XRE-family HTH domain